jgi:signal transduction histidine kinase
VGSATLLRFYVLHCIFIRIAASILILVHSCRIQKEYDRGPIVLAIESELDQVIRNLVKNAIEACTVASPTSSRIARVHIKTETDESTQRALLTVSDNGPGVEPSIVAHLFEDGFSTKDGFGRGHGLYIAQALTQKYGGYLLLDNVSGAGPVSGARFRICLPLASRAVSS